MKSSRHIFGIIFYSAGIFLCIWLYKKATGAVLTGAFYSVLFDKTLHLPKFYNFFINSILLLLMSSFYYLAGVKTAAAVSAQIKLIVPAGAAVLFGIVLCYTASVMFPVFGYVTFNVTGITGIAPVIVFNLILLLIIFPSVLVYKLLEKLLV